MGLLLSEKSLRLCLGFKSFAFVIGMSGHLFISTVLPFIQSLGVRRV